MRRISGVLLTVTGLLACPCHLIVTLPLLAGLFAGTAQGSFLTSNTGMVYALAGIYFVVALALGYWFLFGPAQRSKQGDEACPTCVSVESDHRVQEPPPLAEDLLASRR